ncbi:polyketide synthase family protein [Xenococcus sp. PCC 7305]|uniref:type I polyketide synthase n=1 Tax=Xenococcus sp. PCC 7305 TaxID=102125 RepID=UPI0002AC2C8C|nr:type I polyketide synthase [Xenococcus sp. PCC 7305]ELS00506.1 polyketide synthase family protein [Xenococcus sp. PCC 7305]
MLENTNSLEGIAIIGMSGRFPGAKNINQFWENLSLGKESITTFSDEELIAAGIDTELVNNPEYVKRLGVLENADLFAATFFGFNPKEAELTDPQHRLFLESAWSALENSGYDPQRCESRIGVYAGASSNHYLSLDLNQSGAGLASFFQKGIGNDNDFLATRVSYKLNLTGPSLSVQTACSTSLVATTLACQSLLNYQCDMALAGGVSVNILEKTGYLYQEGGILSPDGHCRAFDAQAKGTIIGNGVGILVLKRLEEAISDRDHIYAVIKGAAINNDGAGKVGYTAPSINGQAEVIAEAMMLADIEPETISYIQAHGTGTSLGDPIEIAALDQVFRSSTAEKGFCAIGSVKTNIGHLDAAAGVAGVIQTALALKHQQIPPSLNFEQPNPAIDFENSPFYVNTQLQPWETTGTPRRAGVSSLGIGGTNAHVILEEKPLESQKSKVLNNNPIRGQAVNSEQLSVISKSRKHQILVISAKTESALETMTDNLVAHLNNHPELDLADVAYTLQMGRQEFNYRRMVVGQDLQDVAIALQSREPQRVLTNVIEQKNKSIVFMFPGQGSQYINMGKDLYQTEPVFREWIDRCSELLEPELGLDLRSRSGSTLLRSLIYPVAVETLHATSLQQTRIAQPAIFALEYALAQLWMSWGIQPQAAIGHSIGEYVAATIAGVFSLEDALRFVAMRGKLMQQMPTGSMLAVSLPVAEVKKLLNEELSLAVINAPDLSVISGSDQAIAKIAQELQEKNIECRHLHTSHAFHSTMMDNAIAPLQQALSKITLNSPQIPFISNVTGTWITTGQATNPNYWAKHMRETVCFAAGISELLKEEKYILLEVGAGRTLSTLVKRNLPPTSEQRVFSSLPHPKEKVSDYAFILNMLGKIWLAGVEIDWNNFSAHRQPYRVPLPTYPFERQRYWIDAPKTPRKVQQGKRSKISDWFYVPSWKSLPLIKTSKLDKGSRYLVFVDELGIGDRIIEKLRDNGQTAIAVSQGENFSQNKDTYTINPNNPEDYQKLIQDLVTSGKIPQKIIHLWNIPPQIPNPPNPQLPNSLDFWSLIYLAQAIEQNKLPDQQKTQILVGTNNLYDIIGDETLAYEQADILGAIKVIPQEYSEIDARQIDLAISETDHDYNIEQLITEFTTDTKDKIVAYRQNRRWVQTFESISLTKNSPEQSKLKPQGIYLITGGMGGIGLALAEHLARTVQAKLILLGRSEFPNREHWEQWLASHDAQDLTSQKICQLKNLETLGAEVLPVTADVCERDAMEQAIALACNRFGTINGVIHGAGVAGGGIIQLKTPAIAETVFAPKVTGTLVLNQVLQTIDLDFLVLCSSLTSIVGGFGQADYCSANAFLDILAHHNRNNCPTVAINWDAWQEVGMAKNTTVPAQVKQWQADNLQQGMLSGEAIEVFERALASDLSQVIVSTQDLPTVIEQNNNFLTQYMAQKPENSASSDSRSLERKNYVAPSNEIEKTIAKILQEVIGLKGIGIHDNFFELGGHSLLAVQVTAQLREIFQVDLSLQTFLFEAPTIAQLANIIINQSLGISEMEKILAEIENLSPEALQQELVNKSSY